MSTASSSGPSRPEETSSANHDSRSGRPSPTRAASPSRTPSNRTSTGKTDGSADVPQETLDRIARLASRSLNVQTAVIGLRAGGQLHWASTGAIGGLRAGGAGDRDEFDLLFRRAHQADEPIVVEDTTEDDWFAERPWLGSVGFYAGVSLGTADDPPLGALYVLDDEPRPFSREQAEILEDLAATAVSELTRHRDLQGDGVQIDVGPLKEAEVAFEHAHDALFVVDVRSEKGYLGFTYVRFNAAAEALTGLSTAEVRGKGPREAFGAETGRKVEDNYRRCVETKKVISYEETLSFPEGTTHWQTKLTPVMGEGAVQQIVGASREISERTRVENELRRNQRLYHQMEQLARVGGWEYDVREETLTWTDEVYRIHEVPLEKEIDVDEGIEFYAPEARPVVRDAFQKTLEDGTGYDLELPIVTAEGNRRWVHTRAAVQEDEGEIVRVFGAIQDITEHKEAEQAVREREARLRGLANSVPGVIFEFYACPEAPAEGSFEDCGISYVSQQAESILGLSADADGFFDRFMERVREDRQDDVFGSLAEAIDTMGRWTFEVPFTAPSGGTMWIRGIAAPEARGDRILFNGVLLDATRDKKLESQLRQSEKMRTAGTLASGLAHDFNNILHSARTYLDMAQKDLPEGHDVREMVARAGQGLSRAEDIVEKLLTFGRGGEESASEEPVDVADIVEESLDLVAASMSDRIELDTHLESGSTVIACPGELHQVVVNLLQNAVDAMEEKIAVDDSTAGTNPSAGALTVLDVDVREVEVDPVLARRYLNLEPGRYVRVTVSDTGPGMTEETRSRIFEPFYTEKGEKGSGLGLAVAYGIVEKCGGEIIVYSEPAHGTTFQVYLLHDGDDGENTGDRAGTDAKGHVLFVDDDPQITDMEAQRIRRLGYAVTTRQRAQDALEMLSRDGRLYDVVIVDHAMPGMTGFELAKAIREAGFDLPVVLTSRFNASIAEKALQSGVTTFLPKPFSSSEVEEILDDLIESE